MPTFQEYLTTSEPKGWQSSVAHYSQYLAEVPDFNQYFLYLSTDDETKMIQFLVKLNSLVPSVKLITYNPEGYDSLVIKLAGTKADLWKAAQIVEEFDEATAYHGFHPEDFDEAVDPA